MNTKGYEIVKGISIANKKNLMDFADKYSDRHIFSCVLNNSPKRILSEGIDIRIGRYSRIVKEFTDPFDFPDGFYKYPVYVPQNDGGLCLELIYPEVSLLISRNILALFSLNTFCKIYMFYPPLLSASRQYF